MFILKQIFCLHKYTPVLASLNFYGSVTKLKCIKCNNESVDVIGYPSVGCKSKTSVIEYDNDGFVIKVKK